jgi:Dihydrofolate reductase
MLSIIVAIAKNNAIGRNNELLWHISDDLKYFKAVTTGHPIIMGRHTYESIGRPLPGRRNIVVTKTGNVACPDIKNKETTSFEICSNIDSIISEAKNSQDEFFITGGGKLYAQMFEYVDKLYITHIDAVAENADTFFPEIDDNIWLCSSETEYFHNDENNIDFKFSIYTRK